MKVRFNLSPNLSRHYQWQKHKEMTNFLKKFQKRKFVKK